MRKFILQAFLSCLLLSFIMPAFSATVPTNPADKIPAEKIYQKIMSMKVRDIQKMTGKKMSFKEKIAFAVLKHKLKKKYNNSSSKAGQTSQTFGIIGLGLLIVGIFVPPLLLGALIASIVAIVVGSSAKKKNPDDRKAHSGKLLGWITLGLIALLLILALIWLASGAFVFV